MNNLPPDKNHWIQAARDLWASQGINLETGAKAEDIESTESFVGFVFPLEMKELYKGVNGFENWDWTPGMISLWPMERIREEYKTGDDKNFVAFCDFLINSHCIGFLKNQPGIYKRYDERYPVDRIAESFKEAIRLINSNSDLIY
jgi:SMI1/KNR4 family protein SUKH-1